MTMKMTIGSHPGMASCCGRADLPRRSDTLERDAAALGDASDDALGAGAQPCTVLTVPEERGHDLAARLAGEAVRDPLLQVVADFHPHPPFLECQQNQQAVVLALLADALAVVREQLDGVFLDVAVRLDRRHRGDDHDVARRGLEGADHPVHRARAVGVDDLGEIVDRLRELRLRDREARTEGWRRERTAARPAPEQGQG